MRGMFVVLAHFEGEQLPTDQQLTSVLAHSSAAEALAVATGCEVCLSLPGRGKTQVETVESLPEVTDAMRKVTFGPTPLAGKLLRIEIRANSEAFEEEGELGYILGRLLTKLPQVLSETRMILFDTKGKWCGHAELADEQASEAEIQAALDFGKTAEQHLRG